jgi:hypothetical protein
MRRYLLVAALMTLPAGSALADPDIGCGLGTQLWEGNKGVLPKALGATTNGSFGNQTFGITFGTIDCGAGTVTVQQRLHLFAGANLDRLARDMAHGEGETLDAFAQLLGVTEADKPAFFRFTKAHFVELYAGDAVTAGDMLISLRRLLAEDTQLAAYAQI